MMKQLAVDILKHRIYVYNQRDMKGETELKIELLIECDKRKISYVNECTCCTKQINVDLDLCPFTWRFYFYLYNAGDRVRILTLTQI